MTYQIRKIIEKPLLKVLLVDDDNDDYLFFKKVLDYQVFKTSLQLIINGEDLLEKLNDEKLVLHDVIFLDINMPLRDGYSCLVEIKDAPRLNKIPIVIYSTQYERNVADMLFEMGADYYIKKATEFDSLRKLIERALCFVIENEGYAPLQKDFLII